MCRALAVALLVLVPLWGTSQVLAASYTWGYGYQRTRSTVAPMAADTASIPNVYMQTALPFIVPLPGTSQSTPVIVHNVWYEWTYWDNGQFGALWTGMMNPAAGTSTPGTVVPLPGSHNGVLQALPGEQFDDPSDAAVSPDGKWVAFSAGKYLYWWPAGNPGAAATGLISGPGWISANSTSPTFMADSASPSGWDVCDGNWDGGFACYQVGTSGIAVPTHGVYQVTQTTMSDGNGYTAITSSAAYGGPLHDLYFGVASAAYPRVVQLDPRTGAVRVTVPGQIEYPVWAAVALSGTGLYATDVYGGLYGIDLAGNLFTYRMTPRRETSSRVNIMSPTVSGSWVYVGEGGQGEILAVDGARRSFPTSVQWSGVGSISAITAVKSNLPRMTELVYAGENGGVFISSDFLNTLTSRSIHVLSEFSAVQPGSAPGGYTFTAAVVDHAEILEWSDGATAGWVAGAQGTRGAAHAAAPAGFALNATNGGIQIYHMAPRLTAFVSNTIPYPGARADLFVLGAPGGALGATFLGKPLALQKDAALGGLQRPCASGWRSAAGPNAGWFPGMTASGPQAGCGPFGRTPGVLTHLASEYGADSSSAEYRAYPGYAGLLPENWQAAGAMYLAYGIRLPFGPVGMPKPIRVTEQMPDGAVYRVTVYTRQGCPPNEALHNGGPGHEYCYLPRPQAPLAWCSVNEACMPPAGDRCPAGVAPGVNDMSVFEFRLLCGPLGSVLVNTKVLWCFGNWYDFMRHWYVHHGCILPILKQKGYRYVNSTTS